MKERRYLAGSRLNEGFCVYFNIEMREKNFTALSLRDILAYGSRYNLNMETM